MLTAGMLHEPTLWGRGMARRFRVEDCKGASMTSLKKVVLRSLSRIANCIFFPANLTGRISPVITFGIGLSVIAGQAQASLSPYVVYNDRGGFIRDRQLEIRRIRATGQPIEIRGAVCYSTCTMFLGLPQTCVSPHTEFGFHGPSRSGQRLRPAEFERYSRLIADYYPKPLKEWFMKKGRNRIKGVHRIKGIEIIRLGVKKCNT